jgi:hypothetical protein
MKTVPTKTFRQELHTSNIHGRAAIAKPLITERTLKSETDGVKMIKPVRVMIGNTQYGQTRCPSRCSQHQAERPMKPVIVNAWIQLRNMAWICDDLGSIILVFCWSYNYNDWSKYCQ